MEVTNKELVLEDNISVPKKILWFFFVQQLYAQIRTKMTIKAPKRDEV